MKTALFKFFLFLLANQLFHEVCSNNDQTVFNCKAPNDSYNFKFAKPIDNPTIIMMSLIISLKEIEFAASRVAAENIIKNQHCKFGNRKNPKVKNRIQISSHIKI